MLARAALIAVAVVVIAWLAVMERDLRLQARATGDSRPGATPAALSKAAADLRRARFLNPDTEPQIALAVVESSLGRRAQAIARIEDVVHAEPDNLLAWELLAVYARGSDPAAVRRALEARRRLDPLGARG
jgi:hypothetical protein